MDDILNSVNGRVNVQSFQAVDPDGKKTDLIKPGSEIAEAALTGGNFDLYAADLATQKVALKEDCKPGVYQFAAESVPTFYTQYIDTNGRTRLKLKSMDQLDNIEKVLMSIKYQAFAKSCMAVGEWKDPEPLGQGLEIIPRTDMSDLHAGDLVEVDVLFYGEPLTASAKSIEYITANSASFGQSDGFALFSYISEGKARFRVQSSGQWIISVNHKDDVTADGPLKDLYGKTEQVYHGATLTFHVK
jgi:uncharacterized GH25 family protein